MKAERLEEELAEGKKPEVAVRYLYRIWVFPILDGSHIVFEKLSSVASWVSRHILASKCILMKHAPSWIRTYVETKKLVANLYLIALHS